MDSNASSFLSLVQSERRIKTNATNNSGLALGVRD